MAIVRMSPGVYRDNATGKIINAATPQEAAKKLQGGANPANTPAPGNRVGFGNETRSGPILGPNGAPITPQASRRDRLKAARGQFDFSPKSLRNKLAQEQQAAGAEARQSIGFQNPDQYNPFYSQETSFDEQGNPVIRQNLTPEQQRLLQGGQNLALQGQQQAGNILGGYQPFAMQDLQGERSRIEDEVFKRLTKNLDKDYGDQRMQLVNSLQARGLSPDSVQYQNEIRNLEEKVNDAKSQARGQAVEMGGQELQRSYGMQLGAQQQRLAELGQLQNTGIGFQAPPTPSFQAPNYDTPGASEIDLALKEYRLKKQALAPKGGGGGGGGSAAPAPEAEPFYNSPPPGLA